MDARFRLRALHIVMFLLIQGCQTPLALRKNTVQLGDTVADIHQQQVLDNLAKFVADPYAIPSFALANAGASNITDQCNGAVSVSWVASGFEKLGLDLMGQRQKMNNWTVTPITDPRKLELMRCAYQRAVSQCTGIGESACCPDCQKRFNEFYTGRSVLKAGGSDEAASTAELPLLNRQSENGEALASVSCKECPTDKSSVTAAGLTSGYCWFHCGCKKCVPKHCGYVGHYCDTYVWVPCGPSRDELAKLTLAVLDYATHNDATLPTKVVTAYILDNGQPATQDTANFVVQATIASDEQSRSVIKPEFDAGPLPTQPMRAAPDGTPIPSLRPLPPQLTPMPNTNLLYLQQQLNTVR